MRLPRLDPYVWLILAFSVFALAPLTAPGYFIYGHDARHSVYFLQMFDQSMRDGAWYPRWAADMVFGYGYPLWVILAPLPFFAGEAFHLLGLDFVSAVKLVNGLSILASGLAMYLFASRVMNRNAGLVAAVAYIYIPYHLVDMYVRAAQAELVAFVFPPLVLWGCYELATTRKPVYIPLTALAYAGLLLTHIQTAVIFTPVIALYLVLLWLVSPQAGFRSWSRAAELARRPAVVRVFGFPFQAFLSIVLALGLAAIFLLPAAFERQQLTSAPLIGGAFNYRNHFLNASQLLSSFWGYGYAGENGSDQFSLQLGLLPVLLGFVGLWAWNHAQGLVRVHIAFFLILTAAVTLAMLPLSSGLWEPFSGILAYVQFPWRFLGITAVCLGFLMGAALYAFSGEDKVANASSVPALALAVLLVVFNYPYSEPQHTDAVFNYQTQMEFETKYGELLGDTIWTDESQRPTGSPLVAQYVNGEPLAKAVALDEGTTVKTTRHGGQSDDIEVDASAPSKVLVYSRYFPGWSATIDGQPVLPQPYGRQGLIIVNVPQGKHILRLRFQDSAVRRVGALVSSAAFLVTILALVGTGRSGRLSGA